MGSDLTFEQGPIRPPSEAMSLLLRFSRNCPWNKCLFCPVYKGRTFTRRSLEDIKTDIQTARDIYDEIIALSGKLGQGGKVNDLVISHLYNSGPYSHAYLNVAAWLYYDTGAVFLQDANNLILDTDVLAEALEFLREKFPFITRVTSYARSSTLARKSVKDLTRIREAGLDRVHVGLETGHDPLLKLMKKGTTAAKQIEGGKRAIAAGMELSEYVMPGLGGKEMSRGHAIDTARVLNEINPHFIRLRSLRVPPRIPLYDLVESGKFTPLPDDEQAEEIKLFLETLDGITSTVTSDHIMNLLEEVTGKYPEDKERLIGIVDEYLNLPEDERLIYRLGRRGGLFRTLDDRLDPAKRGRIEGALRRLQAEDAVEATIKELVDQTI